MRQIEKIKSAGWSQSPKKTAGFTLMELMITVAIIGILAAITIPSYTEYVKKTKRTDAKIGTLKIMQMQESYFVQHMSYAKSLDNSAGGLGLGGIWVDTEHGDYKMGLPPNYVKPSGCDGTSNNPCTHYEVWVKPKAGSTQLNDIKCKEYWTENTGRKWVKSNGSWTTSQAIVKDCWK